jgi:hypothetical protein
MGSTLKDSNDDKGYCMTEDKNTQQFKPNKTDAFRETLQRLGSKLKYDPKYNPTPWALKCDGPFRYVVRPKTVRSAIINTFCASIEFQADIYDAENNNDESTLTQKLPEHYLTTAEIDMLMEYLRALCFETKDNPGYDVLLKDNQHYICAE